MPQMFRTVLVANRGEIAVHVIRTLRSMGIRSVAVYSDADALARHVVEADIAVRLGPAPARESYLSIDAIMAAAEVSGAEAIHPGYGFLSENAEFARACESAGVVLVGPPAEAMRIMGDKISAKSAAVAAGVPVVPGRFDAAMSDVDLVAASDEVGYPVLIKPAAGGGGKGMRSVLDPTALAAEIVSARRESLSAFGDSTLFVERLVQQPRHIEVQVLADSHGNVVHLGERECSLQRRHQKIIEEAPSVLLDQPTRERIGASAVELARAVGYVGAGTVEFIVSADQPDEFFFLEMNTRLQVEHPVTEMVTRLDLVAEQIRIAAGLPLSFGPEDVETRGHAVEARVYAEDPAHAFLPTGGRVLALREPTGEHVRVDSGINTGSEIGSWYDPMLAKVIAWGPDRSTALASLHQALADMAVLGVHTNLEFLQRLLAEPAVVAGDINTELVERILPRLVEPLPASDEVLAAYALIRLLALQPSGDVIDPWETPSGWRVGETRPLVVRPDLGDADEVRVWGSPDVASVSIGDGPRRAASARVEADGISVFLDGVSSRWSYAVDAGRVWLHSQGVTRSIGEVARVIREVTGSDVSAGIRSPMPGVVLAVHAALGDEVIVGQPLIVVEAMKMEHTIVAPNSGSVSELFVAVGDQVTLDQALAVVTTH